MTRVGDGKAGKGIIDFSYGTLFLVPSLRDMIATHSRILPLWWVRRGRRKKVEKEFSSKSHESFSCFLLVYSFPHFYLTRVYLEPLSYWEDPLKFIFLESKKLTIRGLLTGLLVFLCRVKKKERKVSWSKYKPGTPSQLLLRAPNKNLGSTRLLSSTKPRISHHLLLGLWYFLNTRTITRQVRLIKTSKRSFQKSSVGLFRMLVTSNFGITSIF